MRLHFGIFFLSLFVSCQVFSQSEQPTPTIAVSCDKFISVFFPGKIQEIINTNADLEIKTSDASKSSLQIKARNPGFQQARIEIVTVDKQHFFFDVSLSDQLQGSNKSYHKASDKRRKNPTLHESTLPEKSDGSDVVQ